MSLYWKVRVQSGFVRVSLAPILTPTTCSLSMTHVDLLSTTSDHVTVANMEQKK